MATSTYPSLLYLWNRRTLYLGPLFEPIRMKNGAASLAVALNGTMDVVHEDGSERVRCRSFLVPAGTAFYADTGDALIANCMLDVLGQDYDALYGNMQNAGENPKRDISYTLKNEAHFIAVLTQLYQSQFDSVSAATYLNQLMESSINEDVTGNTVDPRIIEIIEFIKSNIDQNISVEALASKVNISVPHLLRIFKSQTGVPIRRFRLWHRLYVASEYMAKTGNLTSAALHAGFSDASHFLHTFQDMVGMRASLLLNQPNKISIITES